MQVMNKTSVVWYDVCDEADLVVNSGVCALINAQQIAIFKVKQASDYAYFGISNWDPIGKANVLYRGIVGSVGDDIVVASPLYKQHYSLSTGNCYESDEASVHVYTVKVIDGRVQVAAS